ncbi:MAG: hypothetical protein R3C14_44335 [Caldilineaceae bacterium]
MKNLPTPEQQEEFMLLMSLALDNLLDEDEAARFAIYQTEYSPFARQWDEWQQLHGQLLALPHVMPAADFVQKVECRLVHHERRQRLWLALLFGAVTFVLWITVMTAAIGLGAYLVVNQSSWLGVTIQNLTYTWVEISQWLSGGWEAFVSFAATPQAKGLGAAYLAFTVALLAGWLNFLRRSTHLNEPSPQVSAA